MALVVLKFGGTSLGNTSRIKNICGIIKKYIDQSHTVVVVVSAMGGVTDQLVSLVRDLSPQATGAEYDVVVSSGENVSAGLVALALNNMGVDARSWLGWQLPIQVNGAHKNGEIDKICTDGILENIDSGVVPVIAGFQGARNNEIYTLGRGGTDTTAVAIAAAINADKCYIYTDVEGVFSSDPRIIPKVKKLDSISFAEILEMAENGAKVLHPKAVAIAMHNKTSVEVLSSFTAN
ncbi:UNVERIFIED_CONTAM: hypothetical protein GTU68_051854, partial [Idotea baltica]|nr:hypothetical protein [Idotea baltica]